MTIIHSGPSIAELAALAAQVDAIGTLDVTIGTVEIKRAMSTLKPFTSQCSRYGGLPSLGCVKLTATAAGEVTLTATDLDIGATVTLSADVRGTGSVLLPVKAFTAMIPKSAKGGGASVSLRAVEMLNVEVSAGGGAFTLSTPDVADYPRAGHSGTGTAYPVSLASVRTVLPAASREGSRPILTGLYFTAGEIVATDSYRLHMAKVDTTYPDTLVPARVFDQVAKLKDVESVTMTIHDFSVSIDCGAGITMTSRIIEGDFPNYRQLIPVPSADTFTLTVDRAAMIAAIAQVSAVLRDPTTPVRLAMSADKLTLSVISTDHGTATATLPATFTGADGLAAFNPKYLTQALEAGAGTEVRIAFTMSTPVAPSWDKSRKVEGPTLGLKPAMITDEGGSCSRLLMPVRVS